MQSEYSTWHHPYTPAKKYNKRAAYFSMEFGIHQGLKIYSGGLGFLAGSHMRSAYKMKQNLIGIGMLWKYGYYDQGRNKDRTLRVETIEKTYGFLEDTGLEVSVQINDNPNVRVKAYVLPPEVFNTVPIYLLTTDVEGNDYLSRTITDHLYDNNEQTRVSQSIVLGIGGAKIVEKLGGAEVYHLNEGHALPAFYHLKNHGLNGTHLAFTTHTPEKGGNEERSGHLLNKSGFFGKWLNSSELDRETVSGGNINYTVSALGFAKKANAVSKLHAEVSRRMWNGFNGSDKIIPITNAQDRDFWQEESLEGSWKKRDMAGFRDRKAELKRQLFETVLDQTGKRFDPAVATMVWARRFAGYKRADLLLRDLSRFEKIIADERYPIQIIWAGKPYPHDHQAIDIFNRLVHYTKSKNGLAVLTGYEIELSYQLKTGSDIWLNTPRITREASGTSGMTAAMNGSVNLSINDGWIPEFAKDGKNCFLIPEADHRQPWHEQDEQDGNHLYRLLEEVVLPTYYDQPDTWSEIVFQAMDDVIPEFTSERMARQYYEELYR